MPEAYNFIKKEILAQVFSCGFCETSKNTFFTEHIWATASDYTKKENELFSWRGTINGEKEIEAIIQTRRIDTKSTIKVRIF